MAKKFYMSKIFWVNLIVAVVFGFFGVEIGANPQLELAVIGIVNIVLRFVTNQPISV